MTTLEQGQIISGKYKIIEKIGTGATARVYLAFDLIQEIEVALKVLKDEDLTEKKIKNFKKEAKAISLLNHDNIIKIYEINDEDGLYYIAQEYVEGMTLRDYIKRSKIIPIEEAQKIILQVLKGLNHAHKKGVIHKDIKSQNILLSINNEVKITDFGIADILEDDMTRTQSLMGTPQYVAPEVLHQQEVTQQTDIYSTGILLYELLIGKAPFVGEKATVIIMKQINQPIPTVKNQREDIPQSLENVLFKATAKNLENRYTDAREMFDDLKTVFSISRVNEERIELKNDFNTEEFTTTNLGQIKEISLEEEEKKKKRKKMIIISSIIGVILLFLSILLIMRINADNTVMPNLVKQPLEDAKIILKNLEIDEEDIKVEFEYSEEVDADNIIKTTPEAGETLNKDDTVVLVVSQGKESETIQDYVGEDYEQVQYFLETEGYIVEVFLEYSDETEGTILEQTPASGEEIAPGGNITLVVSQGKETAIIPNFLGTSQDEASAWASENGMNISQVSECSDQYDEGEIISQSPEYNSELQLGTQIQIVVSEGACPKEETEEVDETTDGATDSTQDKTSGDTAQSTTNSEVINLNFFKRLKWMN